MPKSLLPYITSCMASLNCTNAASSRPKATWPSGRSTFPIASGPSGRLFEYKRKFGGTVTFGDGAKPLIRSTHYQKRSFNTTVVQGDSRRNRGFPCTWRSSHWCTKLSECRAKGPGRLDNFVLLLLQDMQWYLLVMFPTVYEVNTVVVCVRAVQLSSSYSKGYPDLCCWLSRPN